MCIDDTQKLVTPYDNYACYEMGYFRPFYSKIHLQNTRHEVLSTTTQRPRSDCCVGVSCRGEATVSEARDSLLIT